MIEAESPAEAAAKWWAEQVVDPEFRVVRPGEHDMPALFAEGMMYMVSDKHPVTREQADRFASILHDKIEEWQDDRGWFTVGTDYGPDPMLGEAADAAGIHPSRFPIKSMTAVTLDRVVAALGYGARSVLIWSRPGWERGLCRDQRYDRVTHKFSDEQCGQEKFHEGECGDWQPATETCKGCGLTYAGHYNRQPTREDLHSWEPTGAE